VEFVALVLPGLLIGALVALPLASSRGRVVLLLAAGIVLAAAYFGLVWLVSPASADEADSSCSDCGQWLGRWWEGQLVLFITAWNLLGWGLGVFAGAGLRRVLRPARARPA
jgi:hypothetical protein